jgi:hypothetical protein
MKVLSGLLALLTSSQGQMLNEVTLPWMEHLLLSSKQFPRPNLDDAESGQTLNLVTLQILGETQSLGEIPIFSTSNG